MRQYWRVFALVALLMAVGGYQLYGLFSNQGYMPEQPVHYSHVTHAGALQMECLYCHHQAEKGPHAGIPAVELCMGCHKNVQTGHPEIQKLTAYYEAGQPVPWVRIHRLPDHAYFSHQWHVAAGVACQECHGPIQNMPVVEQFRKLEMGECMTCHRQSTYAENIYHPPTYHQGSVDEEQTIDKAEHALVAEKGDHGDSANLSEGGVAYASVSNHMEKYYSDVTDPEKAKKLVASLNKYVEDIYIHGRAAQLRNQNASVECSTCHY